MQNIKINTKTEHMKRTILFFAIACMALQVYSQDFSRLKDITFTKADEYKPAEAQVLECSDYLLSTPIDKNNINRAYAIQYILKWMEGTPDYTFSIDKNAMDLTGKDPELISVYFAALSKAALDNNEKKLSTDDITKKATGYLLDYCANPDNKVKKTKALKKKLKERSK
jgi:hypothetical protein